VLARIIAIVDNYDAMASHRVYHDSRNHEYVIGIMQDDAGSKHDPYLLGRFMDVIQYSPLRVA
jgi:HD-GYP domain-containing protein (c-di-GMP phosphodiesterase class II)